MSRPRADQSERSEAIAMIGRGLAHDINNLMETVLGNAALLREKVTGTQGNVAALEAIEMSAELAGRLTQRILALTQGRDDHEEAVNVNAIVYHLLLVEETQLAPRIRVVRHIDPNLWKVCGNHTEIAQVLLNLATNAVDSIADTGLVTVWTNNVRVDEELIPPTSGAQPGPYVLITVEDNGTGIGAQDAPKVFEAGYTTKLGHTGQGLASASSLVRAHHGFISCTSYPGQGSAFRVYLPAMHAEPEPVAPPSIDYPGGNETVLVVDDERMIAEVMRETLKRLGYNTLMARNGQEAVDIAKAYDGPIHLTLLDLAMPVMGGADAYPLLKQAHPEMRVIICTGFEQEFIYGAMVRQGVDGFLLKPFRLIALAREVRKILDGAPAA